MSKRQSSERPAPQRGADKELLVGLWSETAWEGSSENLPTRASLLARLRQASSNQSWGEFFNTYWRLLYNTSRKQGLSDDEAQEVVQNTMIEASKRLPNFDYDPNQGSFKGWLMRLTFWKIQDQFRARSRELQIEEGLEAVDEVQSRTFEDLWEEDWRKNLIQTAIEKARPKFSAAAFQVFTLCVLQNKGPRETAAILGLSRPRVYLVTHRVGKVVHAEIQKLQREGKV